MVDPLPHKDPRSNEPEPAPDTMTNFFVAVTAYERPRRFQRLMMQLDQQRGVRTDVHSFYDGPDPPDPIAQTAKAKGELHTTKTHLGKEGYWRLVNYAMFEAELAGGEDPWDLFLFVQDDMSLDDPNLLRETGEIVAEIRDHVPSLVSFNLYGDGPEWSSTARWTGRPVVQMIDGWVFASWTDMAAVVFTPLAFDVCPRLHEPTDHRTGTSSGVGRQFSREFDAARCAQVMVPRPVVEHKDGGVSKMNPDEDRS